MDPFIVFEMICERQFPRTTNPRSTRTDRHSQPRSGISTMVDDGVIQDDPRKPNRLPVEGRNIGVWMGYPGWRTAVVTKPANM